jgi:hypothetical protein
LPAPPGRNAVARLPLAASTGALYLVPAVALAVAYAWLGEVPHPVELLGGALSNGGVALIHRRPPAAQAPAGTTRFAEPSTVAVPAGLPGSMRGQSEA